jgi:hypothetical protein
VTRSALFLAVALGMMREPCGTDTSAAGLYAPCTRTKDCASGLTCIAGACAANDGGGEGGEGGAGAEGGDDAGLVADGPGSVPE